MSNIAICSKAANNIRDVCAHASTCIHNNVLLLCYNPGGGGRGGGTVKCPGR